MKDMMRGPQAIRGHMDDDAMHNDDHKDSGAWMDKGGTHTSGKNSFTDSAVDGYTHAPDPIRGHNWSR